MKYILYNPLANNRHVRVELTRLKNIINEKKCFVNITKTDVKELYLRLKDNDEIVLCGGDGTLHNFINEIYDVRRNIMINYYKTGNGNDFARDVKDSFNGKFVALNPFINRLPKAFIKGKEYRFINNVGFGLDGYCCEEGDKIKKKSHKKVNYSLIALKGLLYDYKPTNATVTVDGLNLRFKKVIMAPVMKGKYYGGGVKIAPKQNRLDEKDYVTLVVVHDVSKLRALTVFPLIFSGKHIKYKDIVTIIKGNNIKVEFDRPSPLQIDGETVRNVSWYEVKTCD